MEALKLRQEQMKEAAEQRRQEEQSAVPEWVQLAAQKVRLVSLLPCCVNGILPARASKCLKSSVISSGCHSSL